jgi:hypothetical protein
MDFWIEQKFLFFAGCFVESDGVRRRVFYVLFLFAELLEELIQKERTHEIKPPLSSRLKTHKPFILIN